MTAVSPTALPGIKTEKQVTLPDLDRTVRKHVDTQPDWYGRDRLVFLRRASDGTKNDQIMVLDRTQVSVTSTGTTMLTTGLVKLPTWSPDGRRIAYLEQANEDAPWRLMVMDADGTDPHPIDLPGDPNVDSLSWGTH